MTIEYSGNLFRLLFRWHGSIWKTLWRDLLIFLSLYMVINFSYRFGMTEKQMLTFSGVVQLAASWIKTIPLQFLLGFYVSYMLGRWWNQLNCITWPDKFLTYVTSCYPGASAETRMLRRTVARLINLQTILVWRDVCSKVRKRFPDMTHLIQSGLMTEEEYEMYRTTTDSPHGKTILPIQWIANIFARTHQEGQLKIRGLLFLTKELYSIKGCNATLYMYDWVAPPLIYTQLATMATYGYFLLALIAHQAVSQKIEGTEVDLYVPIVTILEFLFYVGWLKVADEVRSPFGEGDHDFDMNYIVDRNLHISFLIVDEAANQCPKITKDVWWDNNSPRVPHTKASSFVRDPIPEGRFGFFNLTPSEKKIVSDDYIPSNIAMKAVMKTYKMTRLDAVGKGFDSLGRTLISRNDPTMVESETAKEEKPDDHRLATV